MKQQSILIIEDCANLVFTLQKFLKTIGYTSVAVYDGASGLQKAQFKDISLILLDIGLPDISGIEVLNKVREFTNKPIIIISSNSTDSNKIASFENKANIFHEKPINYELLKAQIDSLINRNVKKEIVKLDQYITVDKNSNTVFHNGKEVSLTNREYSLLNLLMRYRGQTVSRKNIMQIFDPLDKLNSVNSVDATVCRLRKKLHCHPKDGFIQSINGKGYRIKKQECKEKPYNTYSA